MKSRILILAGQSLDAATFALFFALVPASVLAELGEHERNPLVLAILAVGGVAGVVFVKIALPAWVVWQDRRRNRPRPRLSGILMLAAATSGFVGATFNSMAILAVLGG